MSNIIEFSYNIVNKKEIFKRNLIAGIARGIGDYIIVKKTDEFKTKNIKVLTRKNI